MAFEKILAIACLVAQLAAASGFAQDPFGETERPAIPGRTGKITGQPPHVYEVSKAGSNQKKLFKVFAAVQKATSENLTTDEFVRRLKSREHFEIRFPEKCRTCRGWGRVGPARGKRSKDGTVRCPKCHTSGIEMRTYIVKWSANMITHKGDKRDPIMAGLRCQLGDKASALIWYNTAKKHHAGEFRDKPNARKIAHAAYEEAVKLANAAFRDDQPAGSDSNKLHRHIIEKSLEGIAATAPKREEEKPSKPPATKKYPKPFRIEDTQ